MPSGACDLLGTVRSIWLYIAEIIGLQACLGITSELTQGQRPNITVHGLLDHTKTASASSKEVSLKVCFTNVKELKEFN